jgi:ankyrin repeat protein
VSNALYDTNVDTTDLLGYTPLHVMCYNGNVDIARLLLSVFARVDIVDNDKNTPIQIANYFGNTRLVSCMSQLLDATDYTPSSNTGANVRATNGVTQATVDVIVSDVSIVASDVRSSVQQCAQRNVTNHTRQQRQDTPSSKIKSRAKIV